MSVSLEGPARAGPAAGAHCPCCGSTGRAREPVLWKELIDEWRLSPSEAEAIDRREGLRCTACGASLRSMALAWALVSAFQGSGTLEDFMSGPGALLRILEVNEAGTLTPYLSRSPGHRLVRHPDVDLQALPFPDGSFDLVVHSDTLEHVERPVRALTECKRVLAAGGFCAFTIPVLVGKTEPLERRNACQLPRQSLRARSIPRCSHRVRRRRLARRCGRRIFGVPHRAL